MNVDAASEILFEGEQAKRFCHERIERVGGVEHSWSVVVFGRRFMLSVRMI